MQAERVKVLEATLGFVGPMRNALLGMAMKNLHDWERDAKAPQRTVEVVKGDWGHVAQELTKLHGKVYAVLNMANAVTPGGGYKGGSPAQEENMFRRTDAHFALTADMLQGESQYTPAMTDLINAKDARVYLDTSRPRVCVRRGENEHYRWMAVNEVFPFYELRSAAQDLRAERFDHADLAKRVEAQFATLVDKKVRHVVLSAFGCGAFRNDPKTVAACYAECIARYKDHFDHIVFAIYYPGYGKDNYPAFHAALNHQ